MNGDPPIDDTAICPACNGSTACGDDHCGFCGGSGGVPLSAAQWFANKQREQQGRMVRWLSGVGEFDTNDPCDEWPIP